MQTERFNRLRKSLLSSIFSKKDIAGIWRKTVRNQLRNVDLKDLYDHYDFNYNIDDRASSLRTDILNGTYRSAQSLVYRIEKKHGICRHLVIPQPLDALVLQVLIESVATDILAKQPSPNAFFSRDKHSNKFPHEVGDYGVSWRQQWKNLQKKIYSFTEGKELIVVTDLSNYYDSVDIKELRKVFTNYTQQNEVVIDLLFRIIEEISWKPDYLPYSSRGLPTTNVEGVRLLAHVFLYEIDEVLKERTGESFTRWMDDIVIGVDTHKEAAETISAVSDMLKSRGLALNVAKTNIYNEEDGRYHFQIDENRYIDQIEVIERSDKRYKKVCSEVHKRFKAHLKKQGAKYWEKVAKRYITTYGKLKCKYLIPLVEKTYIAHPGLRPNIIMYLANIGYAKSTSAAVLAILRTISVFDDISLYQLCELVTQWRVPRDEEASKFLKDFEDHIVHFSFKRKQPSDFYSVLWFKAKYNHPEDLNRFLMKYQNIWQTDSFLRRQVTSVLSRVFSANPVRVSELLMTQISSGVSNTVSVASQIVQFSTLERIDTKMDMYLFPKHVQSPYPLPKFLVLCSVLNAPLVRANPLVKAKVLHQIRDPYYLHWVDAQYNIRPL